jgi:spore germination protein YaaH
VVKAVVASATVVALLGSAALAFAALRPSAPAKPPRRVFAFLSRAGGAEVTRLAQVGRRISVIAPNWYDLDVDSGVIGPPAERAAVLAVARRVGTPVWPVVNARTGGSSAIDDPRARDRIARAVARVARDPAYRGITLDIEELQPTQRDSFSALIAQTATLVHTEHRKLAVYAPRPTVGGSALAYDWTALSRSADLLLAATYNETGPSGPPGPVDTTAGVAKVLEKAASVSRSRVAPIIGAFGYSWSLSGGPGQLLSTVEGSRQGARCGAARVVSDGDASYRCRGRVVYHTTLAGLRARARAVGASGFRWMALFSLGREPRSFWDGMPRVRR